jgi:hypothetical protein
MTALNFRHPEFPENSGTVLVHNLNRKIEIKMTKEEIRTRLSGILENTSKEHPMKVYIPIETGEEVGLSTLEMLTIDKLWMDVTGTIRFTMYGVDCIKNLDEEDDNWMLQVLDYLILGPSPVNAQIF